MRAKLAWAILAAAVVLAGAAKPAPAQDRVPPAISDIRQESGPRSTRLIVECNGPLAYTYYSPDPLTLVVDIPEVDAYFGTRDLPRLLKALNAERSRLGLPLIQPGKSEDGR